MDTETPVDSATLPEIHVEDDVLDDLATVVELPVSGEGNVLSDTEDDSTIDFVTFIVDGETYAFPMDRVVEIIRMPHVVRVPLGPPSLEGVANLRGRVLPIVSLRSCCGLPAAEHDEATRVIVVIDGRTTLGFVVDRVSSVTSVDSARIEDAQRIHETADSELLAGIIKPAHDDEELIKILDVARLTANQFALLTQRSSAGLGSSSKTGAGQADAAQVDADDSGSDDDTLELVSFTVDGQEYALPLDRVQEIVQAAERITTIPNVEPRVLGLMDLRGRLLPVVSLRQVFGLTQAALDPENRIVVIQIPEQGAEDRVVGVVMDTVREVLRVPRKLVADLPEFMARNGRAREVDSVCRLEDGKRLVSVLSAERMFARDDLVSALDQVAVQQANAVKEAGDGMTGKTDNSIGTADGDEELLVVFRLDSEEYGVDIDTVQEIIRVPETLIRVPKSVSFVEGLVNLRGAVLPVVDLRTRLGVARVPRDEQQRIVVLTVNGVRTGFIVDSVTEVLRIVRSDLEPAPALSREQSLLISRVANLAATKRMLMVLEPDQLLATNQTAALVKHQSATSTGNQAA